MLLASLNRIRAHFSSTSPHALTEPRVVPNIGNGGNDDIVTPFAKTPILSSMTPIIGSNPNAAKLEQHLAPVVLPIIGTKHGRGHEYAEVFAARYLAWLAKRPEAASMVATEAIVVMAANQFAPAAGMSMPPPRNLLSALKRSPGVRVKRDVRVRDVHGDVIGKTTMYMLFMDPTE